VIFSNEEKSFMQSALTKAKESFNHGEVPVGAVVVKDGEIIGEGRNNVISDQDVTSHAEINAIRAASKTIKNYRLNKCSIFITLEPCHMCAKAIIDARLESMIFATKEPKTGSIVSVDNLLDKEYLNHSVKYKFGLFEKEAADLLKNFFMLRR
jgi:tRNA(adenine34) deaminase|tara:strand:+ start:4732 stop:5190 length:459 start_codon:yes stop_codon:yes gene_type:complete